MFKKKGLNVKSTRSIILIYLVVLCFFFRAQSFRISGLPCISRKIKTLNYDFVLRLFFYFYIYICIFFLRHKDFFFFSNFTWKCSSNVVRCAISTMCTILKTWKTLMEECSFNKVAGFSLQLKVTLLHMCFSGFLDCMNVTKLRKAPQMILAKILCCNQSSLKWHCFCNLLNLNPLVPGVH